MLRAEDIVEMAKDAARYRFMRDAMRGWYLRGMADVPPQEWDEAVDEEMKEQEE